MVNKVSVSVATVNICTVNRDKNSNELDAAASSEWTFC